MNTLQLMWLAALVVFVVFPLVFDYGGGLKPINRLPPQETEP